MKYTAAYEIHQQKKQIVIKFMNSFFFCSKYGSVLYFTALKLFC